MSEYLLAFIILLAGFLLAFLIGYMTYRRHANREEKVKSRIDIFVQAYNKLKADSLRKPLIDRQQRLADISKKYARRRSLLLQIERKCQRSGLKLSLGQYGALAIALTCFNLIISQALFQVSLWGACIIAPLGAVLMVYTLLDQLEKRQQKLLLNLMPEALDIINRSLKAGLSIHRAIEVLKNEVDEPLKSEFQWINDRLTMGQPLPSILEESAERLHIDDFRFFSIAVGIQYETGGSLAEALNNLAQIIRRRHELRLKIKSLSSEARASAIIVGSLPFLAALGLTLLNPDHLKPFINTPMGQKLFYIGLFMMGLGIMIIRRMIQFKV